MTTYRLFPATNGPAVATVDVENYTMGTEFAVSVACSATAVFVWRPANAPATDCTVGIYRVTGVGTGTLVASVAGVSIPANFGGWYRVPLSAPIALLASPTRYVAVVHSLTDNFYTATPLFWSTGAGAAGISNGILSAPRAADVPGGQSRFKAGTTIAFPTDAFNSTNYWLDVEVDDGPANLPPTVNAGADQSVAYGAAVTLTGTVADSDGTISSVLWEQVSGGVVALEGTGLSRTFVASQSGTLIFRLTATDDDGAQATDTVAVVVAAPVLTRAATSAGALKALIEVGGLQVAAYRDAIPKDASMPVVTIDENVATSPERHGDAFDPFGHHGESEQLFVHLWELWRKPDGKAGERYDLIRRLKHLLRTAPPFAYGPDNAPVRVYGLTIAASVRLVEEEANVVHHTITLTMRRDA